MNQTSEPATEQISYEQYVVFRLDNEEYAVPIMGVTEIIPTPDIMPFPNAPDYILGLTNLRGKVIPVLDLEKKFQLSRNTGATRQHIMVAESEQKVLFGVVVDQVREVLKVPRTAIQPPPEVLTSKIAAEYLPGVIILDNSTATSPTPATQRVLLILDVQKILSEKNIEELHAAQQSDSHGQDNNQDNKESS